MLGAGPAAAVVVPGTPAVVVASEFGHLLRQQHLVEVMHLGIGAAIVVLPFRMVVDGAGRVELESLDALVHKGFQVVHPVLLTGSRASFALSDNVFLGNAQIIFLTEPESEVESHRAELADEQPVVHRLRILILKPVGFRGETVVVPFLLGGEIVTFLHPLRLEPEYVARDIDLAEHRRIVQDVELLFAHIRTEAESVRPLREYVGPSGNDGVKVEDVRHILSEHQEEVGFVAGVDYIEKVFVYAAYVEEALPGGVVVYSPSAGAHHERHRDLGVLVSRPHPEELAPVLDMVAAGAAAAVEAFPVFHPDADDAGLGSGGDLPLVDFGELAFVVAYYSTIICHHVEVRPFFVYHISQVGGELVLIREETDIPDQRPSLGIADRDSAGLLVDRQGIIS